MPSNDLIFSVLSKLSQEDLGDYKKQITKSLKEYNEQNDAKITAADFAAMQLKYIENMRDAEGFANDEDNAKDSIKAATTRFFINIGARDGTDGFKLAAFISETAGIPIGCFKEVKILDNYSFVEIDTEYKTAALSVLNKIFNGRIINIEIAGSRPKEEKPPRRNINNTGRNRNYNDNNYGNNNYGGGNYNNNYNNNFNNNRQNGNSRQNNNFKQPPRPGSVKIKY